MLLLPLLNLESHWSNALIPPWLLSIPSAAPATPQSCEAHPLGQDQQICSLKISPEGLNSTPMIWMPSHGGELFWNPGAPGHQNSRHALEADTCACLSPKALGIPPQSLFGLWEPSGPSLDLAKP